MTFDEAERERLATLDPLKASPEDHAALSDLLQVQLCELGDGIDHLRASHDRLLAAAKLVLSAVHSRTIGHPYDLDSAIDQLDAEIAKAEEV